MSDKRSFYEKVRDPAFWETVRTSPDYARIREYLLSEWKEYADCVIPALKFSDYRKFFDSGERDTYENSYYLRRQIMIVSSFLAAIYPDVRSTIRSIRSICSPPRPAPRSARSR